MTVTSLSCAVFETNLVFHFMSSRKLFRVLCLAVSIIAPYAARHAVAADVPAATTNASGWVDVAPQGTTCWDGSPWRFWYRGGSADKLAIWFEGSGGCWNAATCDVAGKPAFQSKIATRTPQRSGLFDENRANNPLRDFSVVLLPYCTGDAHIGRRTVEYTRGDGTSFRFAHEGGRNTLAALDWLKSRGFDPRTLLVSGESAGAIAAAYWSVEIGDRWPAAQLITLGDAAGGYRALGVNKVLRQWGVLDALPDLPAYSDHDRVYFETFYIAAAQRHPGARLAQVNYADDAQQRRFMSLLGTRVEQLTKPLTCNLNEVRIDAPDFRSFIYPGTQHVMLRTNAVYSTRCEGQSVASWVDDLITGRPLENRWCDGTKPGPSSPVANPVDPLTAPTTVPGL